MDREPARRDALIPNIRSENLSENSFSACTLTRRSGCSCLGCSTSPTAKSRSGFRTAAWRRRSWTETGCNIIHPTLCSSERLIWTHAGVNPSTTTAMTLSGCGCCHNGRQNNCGAFQVRGLTPEKKKGELGWRLLLFFFCFMDLLFCYWSSYFEMATLLRAQWTLASRNCDFHSFLFLIVNFDWTSVFCYQNVIRFFFLVRMESQNGSHV